MSVDVETAGAASIGALTTRQSADLSGQPCRNCGHVVESKYCTACGQLAASFHRPIATLISETISDTFTYDGRLARTIPVLLFRPGRLTRNYTEGKRARYVPPFRLFLLASLLFYFVLFAIVPAGQVINIDDETRAEIAQNIIEGDANETAAEAPETAPEGNANVSVELDAGAYEPGPAEARVVAALNNPEQFAAELENWLPRLSIAMVPMTILAFVLLHLWRRSIYVYDHAIHALHVHSWVYLTGTVVMLAGPLMPDLIISAYFVGFLIYVWRSLAVAGNSGFMMSGLRTLIMLFFWLFAAVAIMIATVVVSGLSIQG